MKAERKRRTPTIGDVILGLELKMTRANDVDGERMFLVRLLLLHTRQDRHQFHQWELLFLLFSCFLLTIFGANAGGVAQVEHGKSKEGRKQALEVYRGKGRNGAETLRISKEMNKRQFSNGPNWLLCYARPWMVAVLSYND